MYIKTLLILVFCFYAASSYKLLKGKDIPKDYAIGQIMYMEYVGQDKIYFLTMQDVLGLIDAKTGILLVVYQLDDDQRILQHRGSRLVVVQKNKDLNYFVPRDQSYFKLKYSQYLQKQSFKKIIAFKRFSLHDYVLTDEFLLKAQNPFAQKNPNNEKLGEKFQIMVKKTDVNEVYFQLIHLVGKQLAVGLVILKQTSPGKKEMCIKKIFIQQKNIQTVCYTFDAALNITKVSEIGPNIIVVTNQNSLIFNNKLQFLKQADKGARISFFDQLNIYKPEDKKNLNGEQKSVTKFFINLQKPQNRNNVQIFQRYFLVKKENTVIVNIEKDLKDIPINFWAFSRDQKLQQFELVVSFVNGKVACYEINQKTSKYTTLWTFNINSADKSTKGQEKQAKEVDLQTEQKLIEQAQTEKSQDIQVNAEQTKNSQP